MVATCALASSSLAAQPKILAGLALQAALHTKRTKVPHACKRRRPSARRSRRGDLGTAILKNGVIADEQVVAIGGHLLHEGERVRINGESANAMQAQNERTEK